MTRTFTWQEIEQDWLGGGALAFSDDEIVHAFNVVAQRFGRDWVEASCVSNGIRSRATSSTLHVVTLGQLLESLGEPANSQHLLNKVRDELPDARAELAALYLVCSGLPDLDLEIEPEILVGNHNRKPDFRIRRPGENWTYVEVTQAGTSMAQAGVQRGLARLSGLVDSCSGNFGLEVSLKRDPMPAEIDAVVAEITRRYRDAGTEQTELADNLGTLYWNTGSPGNATLDDHAHPYRPGFGMMRVVHEDGVPRHILVRWPFTDQRAVKLLRDEAGQLPKDAPGLVMIQTSGAVGAFKSWRKLIEGRFQPNMHTRVSAVCLFSSGQRGTTDGEEMHRQTKLIHNPHGRFALPDWLSQQLERFPSDEPDITPDNSEET